MTNDIRNYSQFGLLNWTNNNLVTLIKYINEEDSGIIEKTLGSLSNVILNSMESSSFSLSAENSILLQELLNTVPGKIAQERLAKEQILMFLQEASALGISDSQCQVFYAILRSILPREAIQDCIENFSDVNDMYSDLCSNGKFSIEERSRIDALYMTVSSYINSGRLENIFENPYSAISSNSSEFSFFILDWILPASTRISQKYGITQLGNMHTGIDILAPRGTPVISPCSGRVIDIESLATNIVYGNTIDLLLTDPATIPPEYLSQNVVLRYSGLDEIIVDINQEISGHEVIGYTGNTGRSYGPHLHLELIYPYQSDSGIISRHNPEKYFDTSFTYTGASQITIIN